MVTTTQSIILMTVIIKLMIKWIYEITGHVLCLVNHVTKGINIGHQGWGAGSILTRLRLSPKIGRLLPGPAPSTRRGRVRGKKGEKLQTFEC